MAKLDCCNQDPYCGGCECCLDMQAVHGLDSNYRSLSEEDERYWNAALKMVRQEARGNAYKRPKMTTLLEEVSEAVLAARGKHEHSLQIELMQVASCALNLLWQLSMGQEVHVNNIVNHSIQERK